MPILYGYTALKNNCDYAANNSLDSDSYNPPQTTNNGTNAPYLEIVSGSQSNNAFSYSTNNPNPNYTPTYTSNSTLYIEFNDGNQNSLNSLPDQQEGLYINNGAYYTLGTNPSVGDTVYIKVFQDANGDDNYIAVEYLSSPTDAHYFSFAPAPEYTVHEYSEVQTHCSTDDNPNDCYAGPSGNAYFTLAINASGEFSYSSLTTNGGTTWNLFQPSYVSNGASGAAYMAVLLGNL